MEVFLLDEVSMLDDPCFASICDVMSTIDDSRQPKNKGADCFGKTHLVMFGDFKQETCFCCHYPVLCHTNAVSTLTLPPIENTHTLWPNTVFSSCGCKEGAASRVEATPQTKTQSSYLQQAREHLSSSTSAFTKTLTSVACTKTDALYKTKQEVMNSRNSTKFSQIFPWAKLATACGHLPYAPTDEATK